MSQSQNYEYEKVYSAAPPESMTMDRLAGLDELVVAQSTQLCLRQGCCRPSINWVLLDSSNYEPGSSPFDLPNVGGWVHEESTFFQRFCCHAPGCRETRFVHHAGQPPASLSMEDRHCCVIQTTPTSSFLAKEDLARDVVAIHEKGNTCSAGISCCYQPYLRTVDGTGRYLGETKYVCDECIFVPKFLVTDQYGEPKFLLRPDTCCGGICVLPRCAGQGGKCLRIPFLVRDPRTLEPIPSNAHEGKSQVTSLWTGLANEVCFRRHAYQVAFPVDATPEDRLTLVGSSILVDVALFEQDDDKK